MAEQILIPVIRLCLQRVLGGLAHNRYRSELRRRRADSVLHIRSQNSFLHEHYLYSIHVSGGLRAPFAVFVFRHAQNSDGSEEKLIECSLSSGKTLRIEVRFTAIT